jgi:hypothetical protein
MKVSTSAFDPQRSSRTDYKEKFLPLIKGLMSVLPVSSPVLQYLFRTSVKNELKIT